MGLKDLAKAIKTDTEQASMRLEDRFLYQLDAFIKRQGDAEELNRKSTLKSIKPSSYAGCLRSILFELQGLKASETNTAKAYRVLDVGEITHRWVQDKILASMHNDESVAFRVLSAMELPVYGVDGVEFIDKHGSSPLEIKLRDYRYTPTLPVSLMVDGAFCVEGINALFEFKTINTDGFKRLIEPQIKHQIQGVLYSLCTGVPRVLFVYIDKNTQDLKAYLVEYTQEQFDWCLNRLKTIEYYFNNPSEIVPAESIQNNDGNCRWCKYKGDCSKLC